MPKKRLSYREELHKRLGEMTHRTASYARWARAPLLVHGFVPCEGCGSQMEMRIALDGLGGHLIDIAPCERGCSREEPPTEH